MSRACQGGTFSACVAIKWFLSPNSRSLKIGSAWILILLHLAKMTRWLLSTLSCHVTNGLTPCREEAHDNNVSRDPQKCYNSTAVAGKMSLLLSLMSLTPSSHICSTSPSCPPCTPSYWHHYSTAQGENLPNEMQRCSCPCKIKRFSESRTKLKWHVEQIRWSGWVVAVHCNWKDLGWFSCQSSTCHCRNIDCNSFVACICDSIHFCPLQTITTP